MFWFCGFILKAGRGTRKEMRPNLHLNSTTTTKFLKKYKGSGSAER